MPAYQRIAETLSGEIADGTYAAGTALPTMDELTERFGVSTITIRGAVDQLTREGLIYSGYTSKRRGMIVRSSGRTPIYATDVLRADRKRSNYDVFSESAMKAGKTPSKHFEMRIELPPAEIGERLGLVKDELAVVRNMRQLLDNEPWSTETSFYPRDLAAEVGLDSPHDIEQGAIRALADAGHPDIAHVDELTDETADEQTAAALSIPRGLPVMVQMRTAASAERVTRVTRYITLGRRVRFLWEIGDDAGIETIRSTRQQAE